MPGVFAQTHRAPSIAVRLSVPIVALCLAAPAAAAPLAGSQTLSNRTTLRVGGRGAAVRELQLALAWHGFPSGTIDGRFGTHLARAVRRFQREEDLKVDGV